MAQSKKQAAYELAELIARMHDDYEVEGGISHEDACATLTELIASARQVTGIHPDYAQYCTECLCRVQTDDDSTLCTECRG